MELARVMSQYRIRKDAWCSWPSRARKKDCSAATLYAENGEEAESENRSGAQQRHHRQRRRWRRPHGKSAREYFQRRPHRFALARDRPLHEGNRRALCPVDERRSGFSRRPLRPRRRSTPFNLEGFAAVRFSTPVENFANQHSATDTFANTSPDYIAWVTKVNGAVAASLAWAPKSPETRKWSATAARFPVCC